MRPRLPGKIKRRISHYCDLLRGLDFAGMISAKHLGFDPALYNDCAPSGMGLSVILKMLNIDKTDCILDIGCGKGAAMRTMCRFPFKLIHGVEISQNVANIAINNFKILQQKRVKIFIDDACSFQKLSIYNYYFLYNPFKCAIMTNVVKNIIGTIHKNPRKITVIYNNPVCEDVLVDNGFFKFKEYRSDWNETYCVYHYL